MASEQKEDKKKSEEEEEEKIEGLGGISRIIKEYGDGVSLYGWTGALGAILNGALMPAFFVLFGELIDIGAGQDFDLVTESLSLMLKFFAVGFGFFLFNAMQYVCWGRYGAIISVNVRKAYFNLLLQQECGYFDSKNSGNINTSLISDCLNIAGMGTSIGLFLQHFVSFLGGFFLAFWYSWQLSLMLMTVVPLFVGVGVFSSILEKQGTGGSVNKHDVGDDKKKDKVDPIAEAGSFSNEVLLSVRSVQSMPLLLKYKLEEYEKKLEAIIPAAKKSALALGLGLGGMFFAFLGAMYSIGYWYGGKLVDNGTIEIGDMYLCMFALPIGAMSLGQLGAANTDIMKARKAANKFFKLQDRKPKIKAPETDKPIEKENNLRGDICFNDVSFHYPTNSEQLVLDKISFKVSNGGTLALVGPSGSGKSTIINLLERYYDPISGDISINNEKIHNFDINYLRKHIGYVPQTPLLFAESIRENIRGGNTNINDDDIIRAAKSADAHQFIMELPEQYDTDVGEMGNRLSGGQKQRIAIARAIVDNPSILLLDEATSALDTKSEREVQKAIDNISNSHTQTIIVIAHRLSTIKNADKILVIVDGEIEERGNHDSLIELNGVYAALVREQQVTDIDSHHEVQLDDVKDNDNNNEKDVNEGDSGKTSTVITTSIDQEADRTDNISVEVKGKDEKDDKDKDKDKKKEKEEEKVPDLGGTKRLNKEYAGSFKCIFYGAFVLALMNGVLWPFSYGWLFPEIITILTQEIECDETALSLSDCSTNFEEATLNLVYYWLIIGTYALVVNVLQSYLYGLYGVSLANKVKSEWFRSMLAQDITYHDTETSSKLNASLTVETQAISDGMGWKYGMLWQSVSQVVVGFGIAFYRSWRVTLVFVGLTPLMAIAGILQSIIFMGTGSDSADPFIESGSVSQEILTNIRTVLAFPYLIITKNKLFGDKVENGLPIATKRAAISGLSMGINLMIAQGIVYGVGMYAGLRFVEKGWVTFDDVMGAFFGVFTGGMGVGQAMSVFAAFQKAKIAANKFYSTKDRKPDIREAEDSDNIITKGKIQGEIQFKNVSFSYHSRPDTTVLNNISFNIAAGQSLAIVGPSGSGKSTIVSLIERFYDNNSGDILIDDQKINNYDLLHLRKSIGLVSQMPLLFDTTINENIRAGNKDASQDDIIEAAKSANAHDFIEKFDLKYNTLVGELGNKLSGGQRQRIAIARALLNKPTILLLDEATSALDSKSEREVQDAIDKITENKNNNQTIISIAHRLSTIKNSDQILVIVDGEIEERGNHQVLMDKGGIYYALVNAQQILESHHHHHNDNNNDNNNKLDGGTANNKEVEEVEEGDLDETEEEQPEP